METKDTIQIEGMEKEDPARLSVISRMASMMSKQLSQKGKIEKLEIIKYEQKVKMRLLLDTALTESEGEDKNLFFAFGKAQEGLFKKLHLPQTKAL